MSLKSTIKAAQSEYALEVNLLHLKLRLEDARGEHTTSEDVLLGGRVVGQLHNVDSV